MNFDKFIEILSQHEEMKDWYIENTRFKGTSLIRANVVFEFSPEDEVIEEDGCPD